MKFDKFYLVELHDKIDLLFQFYYNILRNSTKFRAKIEMRTAFIGHRKVFAEDIEARLVAAIQTEIERGCTTFTMGTHGEFDRLAMTACRNLRRTYKELDIEVVITSLNAIKKDSEFTATPYADVKTVMFDVEDAHYKQRITLSNRLMIDGCDTLICYVDECVYRSGAKTAMRYAKKKGLKIINLYRDEDQPFYGMSREEIEAYWRSVLDKN